MPQSTVTLFVCVSCRTEGDESERPGSILFDAMCRAAEARPGVPVMVKPVRCLSVCRRPCTVAFLGDGKWTYVIGDIESSAAPDEVLSLAEKFGATTDGIIPWRERPIWYRKGVVARVPPLDHVPPEPES